MSSFYCDKCGALHSDTRRGYIAGCVCDARAKALQDRPSCDACGTRMVRYDVENPNAVRCPRYKVHEE